MPSNSYALVIHSYDLIKGCKVKCSGCATNVVNVKYWPMSEIMGGVNLPLVLRGQEFLPSNRFLNLLLC